jgi:hypothetical protein
MEFLLTKSIISPENQRASVASLRWLIAEDEIADRFQLKSVIVPVKIRIGTTSDIDHIDPRV